MKKTAYALLLTSAIALSACKGATTAAPVASKDAIYQEQMTQQELAQAEAIKRGEGIIKVTDSMKSRFKTVAAKIAPAGESLCKDIRASKCQFGFKIEESAELNAYADGNYIVVSTAMIDFTSDDELATVISHEYAHNIMGHVASQTQNAAVGGILGTIADQLASSQGFNTGGAIGKLGQNYSVMRYSVGFEQEADYVGLYVMERAGYDINKAPALWRKMSQADARGISMRSTHPSNSERYVALSQTIAEIQAKKAAKQPLVPEFRKK